MDFPESTEMLNKYVQVGDTDGFDITKHCKEYGVRNNVGSSSDKSIVSHIEFNNLVNGVNELEQIVQKLSEKLPINNQTIRQNQIHQNQIHQINTSITSFT